MPNDGHRNVELLVHVDAPCTTTHDAYHRALAEAYLNFQPARTTSVLTMGAVSSLPRSQVTLKSPDLSFIDVDDNVGSPSTINRIITHQPPAAAASFESASSFAAPPSEVDDSQPWNDLTYETFCSPTRILEHQLRSSGSTFPLPQPHPQQITHNTAISSETPVLDPESSSKSSSVVEVPSSFLVPPPRTARQAEVDSFSSRITCSERAGPEPPAKRRRTSQQPKASTTALERCVSDVGPAGRQVHKNASPRPPPGSSSSTTSSPRPAWLDALSVTGPEPPASSRDLAPEDLLTPNLCKLYADLSKQRRRYEVCLRRQEPGGAAESARSFERGWWTLDCCSSWGKDVRRRTWDYLARYVGAGRAGWGVSLTRRSQDNLSMRLFCYKHVVPHMYLLLYVATRSRVYEVDCTWTSAVRGEAILVPAKGKTGS